MSAWAVLALLPAFGVDTFAVAAGFGATGGARAWRLAVTLALFEGGMPLVGAVVGRWLGAFVSADLRWMAVGLLAVLGLRGLWEGWAELREGGEGEERPAAAAERRWAPLLAGFGASVDEWGAGLAAGAAGLPLRLLVPALMLQAVLLTWAGLHAGAALRRLAGRYGELAAGAALLAAAAAVAGLGR